VDETIVQPETEMERWARFSRDLGPGAIRALTLWKWRYSLESQGFTAKEAARLLFLSWRYGRSQAAVGG
jgi:hypothetical protein